MEYKKELKANQRRQAGGEEETMKKTTSWGKTETEHFKESQRETRMETVGILIDLLCCTSQSFPQSWEDKHFKAVFFSPCKDTDQGFLFYKRKY